jgi:hypothetical protein
MRQLTCILLLLIFSVQLLPIECVGKILYSQVIQEEIPHHDDKPVEKSGKGLEVFFDHSLQKILIQDISYLQAKHLSDKHDDYSILAHWLETFSPPPEFA